MGKLRETALRLLVWRCYDEIVRLSGKDNAVATDVRERLEPAVIPAEDRRPGLYDRREEIKRELAEIDLNLCVTTATEKIVFLERRERARNELHRIKERLAEANRNANGRRGAPDGARARRGRL